MSCERKLTRNGHGRLIGGHNHEAHVDHECLINENLRAFVAVPPRNGPGLVVRTVDTEPTAPANGSNL